MQILQAQTRVSSCSSGVESVLLAGSPLQKILRKIAYGRRGILTIYDYMNHQSFCAGYDLQIQAWYSDEHSFAIVYDAMDCRLFQGKISVRYNNKAKEIEYASIKEAESAAANRLVYSLLSRCIIGLL